MNKITVTGATGFIGYHLVQQLLLDGYEVTSLSRSYMKPLDLSDKQSTHIITTFSQEELVDQLNNCDVLIHLAGRRISRDDKPNMIYPFVSHASELLDNLLYAAHKNGIKKIIFASSIGVYSDANESPYREDSFSKPATLYGLTKLFSEQRLDFYSRQYNIPIAHIRLAQCYGYGEKNTPALMSFIEKALDKETITLTNGGSFPIDQIYIDDAVQAFITLINSDKQGAFNIGSGVGYSILEIAKTVNTVFNNEGNLKVLPKESDVRQKHMSIAKAKKELGWEPRFSLYEGLQATQKTYNIKKRKFKT